MSRMIPQAAVEALLDRKIEGAERLLSDSRCKGTDRHLIQNTVSNLLAIRRALNEIESGSCPAFKGERA